MRLFVERVLMPLVGMIVIVAGLFLLPPAIAAAEGHGVIGLWSATKFVSSRNGSYWLGTFRAAHRNLVVRNVDIDGLTGPQSPGVDVRVLYPGGDEAFLPNDKTGWLAPALFICAGVGIVAYWTVTVPVRLWRARKRRAWSAMLGR